MALGNPVRGNHVFVARLPSCSTDLGWTLALASGSNDFVDGSMAAIAGGLGAKKGRLALTKQERLMDCATGGSSGKFADQPEPSFLDFSAAASTALITVPRSLPFSSS